MFSKEDNINSQVELTSENRLIRASPSSPFQDDDHRAAIHTAFEPILDVTGGFDTKRYDSRIELTPENRLIREGCLGANKHMFKPIINQCGTLGIETPRQRLSSFNTNSP